MMSLKNLILVAGFFIPHFSSASELKETYSALVSINGKMIRDKFSYDLGTRNECSSWSPSEVSNFLRTIDRDPIWEKLGKLVKKNEVDGTMFLYSSLKPSGVKDLFLEQGVELSDYQAETIFLKLFQRLFYDTLLNIKKPENTHAMEEAIRFFLPSEKEGFAKRFVKALTRKSEYNTEVLMLQAFPRALDKGNPNPFRINSFDARGWTPLHQTVKAEHKNLTKLLCKGGANPDLHSRPSTTNKISYSSVTAIKLLEMQGERVRERFKILELLTKEKEEL